jgi:hypothetical protein
VEEESALMDLNWYERCRRGLAGLGDRDMIGEHEIRRLRYVYITLNGVETMVINGITGFGYGFDGRDSDGNLDAICGGPLRNWRLLKRDGVLSGELLRTQ